MHQRHNSVNNAHGMYWKRTKNFQSGDLSHVKDSRYLCLDEFGDNGMSFCSGLFLGPGGHGAFVIENVELWV